MSAHVVHCGHLETYEQKKDMIQVSCLGVSLAAGCRRDCVCQGKWERRLVRHSRQEVMVAGTGMAQGGA